MGNQSAYPHPRSPTSWFLREALKLLLLFLLTIGVAGGIDYLTTDPGGGFVGGMVLVVATLLPWFLLGTSVYLISLLGVPSSWSSIARRTSAVILASLLSLAMLGGVHQSGQLAIIVYCLALPLVSGLSVQPPPVRG